MSDMETPNMTPADALLADDFTQTLKACIPFFHTKEQIFLLIFAKWMEFHHSLRLLNRENSRLQACSVEPAMRTPVHLLNQVRMYCSDNQKKTIDSLLNAFQLVQIFQFMQGQSSLYQSSSMEIDNSDNNFLSEEQMLLFRQFSEMVNKEQAKEGALYE